MKIFMYEIDLIYYIVNYIIYFYNSLFYYKQIIFVLNSIRLNVLEINISQANFIFFLLMFVFKI